MASPLTFGLHGKVFAATGAAGLAVVFFKFVYHYPTVFSVGNN